MMMGKTQGRLWVKVPPKYRAAGAVPRESLVMDQGSLLCIGPTGQGSGAWRGIVP